MGVVDEAVENGIGIGRVTDDLVPFVDGNLAGEEGRAAAVAFFEDFIEIAAGAGVERIETPIVEDEELGAGEGAHDAGVAPVAARQREIGEQLGDALIQNRAVVAAGLVAERTGKPAFADARRPAQDQIVGRIDPLAAGEFVEQRPIETAMNSVIDVLDDGIVAQSGIAQPSRETLVPAMGDLALDEQAKPIGMGEPCTTMSHKGHCATGHCRQ